MSERCRGRLGLLGCALLLGLAGCQEDPSPGDSGQDDGLDAGPDAGPDIGPDTEPGLEEEAPPEADLVASDEGGAGDQAGDGPDHDPTREFLIHLPEGAALCASFRESASWSDELARRVRLDLAPGFLRLPRVAGALELETPFITGLRVGPERRQAAPLPVPEECLAEHWSGTGWEAWVYRVTRAFELDGETLVATAVLELIRLEAEQPTWPERIEADAAFRQWALHGGIQASGSGQPLVSCDPPEDRWIEAETAAGDRVRLSLAGCPVCGCSGNTSCLFLAAAELELGGEARGVADPLDLAYSAEHHNFSQRYALRLAPPLAGADILLLEEPDTWAGTPGQLVLFGADLQELSRTLCSRWESAP